LLDYSVEFIDELLARLDFFLILPSISSGAKGGAIDSVRR